MVHFKCGYKNRNSISWGSNAGDRNHSILSTRYLIQAVQCLQNGRLDTQALDWASRNSSQDSAAQLCFQKSCSCAIRRGSNWEVATESAGFESLLPSPWSRDQKVALTPAKLGIGHRTMAAAKLNSWRCRKMPSVVPLKSKTSMWNWCNLVPRTRTMRTLIVRICLASRFCRTGRHSRRNLGMECQFKISTTEHINLSNNVARNSSGCETLWSMAHHLTNQTAVSRASCTVV